MKHIKYTFMDKADFIMGINYPSSVIFYNTKEQAQRAMIEQEVKDREMIEELSHIDINIEPTEYHIYKIERMD